MRNMLFEILVWKVLIYYLKFQSDEGSCGYLGKNHGVWQRDTKVSENNNISTFRIKCGGSMFL
jgi:hypothetical protein